MMNGFSLLFILLTLSMAIAGLVLLIIAIIKRKWKLALLAIAGPIAGYATMVGIAFVAIRFLDIRLKREVSPAEVIGVWKLRDESLNLAKKEGYAPSVGASHGLDIRADGSCHYRSIGSYPIHFEEHEGFWSIRPAPEEDKIYELYISTKEDGGFVFSVSFTEEMGKLVIWEYLGDPDNGTYLKFDKQPNQPPKPMLFGHG